MILNKKRGDAFAACIGAVACMLAAAPLPSFGAPLAWRCSLADATVTLGEPIILDYVVTNPSSDTAVVDLGVQTKDWLTLQLFDARGNSVPHVPDQRPRQGGYMANRVVWLKPGESFHNQVAVSQIFAVATTGKYRLSSHANLPYGLGSPEQNSALVSDQSLQVTVTPRDPTRLRVLADKFSVRISDPNATPDEVGVAVEALFSMPEADVLSLWSALARNRSLPQRTEICIIRQMQRVASRACIDMLGEIWGDSKAPAAMRQAAYAALSNMWKDASPPLKERIRSIYTAVEGKAPDSIIPLIDVD